MSKPLVKVLHVDLTAKTTKIASRPELFRKYIGGTGVASKLLLEECPPKIDPFSPETPLILATGPMAGIFPSMARAVAMFKSPLTGNLGESHAGGYLATALRYANLGAIIVKGSSDKPVSLIVENDELHLEDASSLWGRSPLEVEENLQPDTGRGVKSVMSIGRAGENYINYASAIVDRYHHFGRLGLGAVMGSKKLKAVCVYGADEPAISERSEIYSIREEMHRLLVETDVMEKYNNLGTAGNVLVLNKLKALPCKNFSKTTYDRADDVSGENFAQKVLEKKVSCPGCPIACIHLGTLNTPSEAQPMKKRGSPDMELVPYNYEPIFALGINLDVSDPKKVLRLIARCGHMGMDAIMTGAVLAWATEAYAEGLIANDETMGLKPEWGNVETYLEMIDSIANVRTKCYAAMARGVAAAAEGYGGKDFAVSLGKNSPAGYLTGYGHVVGTLVGARHSHLSNAGYSVDQLALMSNTSPEGIVEFLVQEEDWINVLNSLIACYFSRDAYNKEIIIAALAAVGVEYTATGLMRLGKEISRNLHDFKLREGFDLTKEKIPRRLLEAEGPTGQLNPEIVRRMISHYIKIREGTDVELASRLATPR